MYVIWIDDQWNWTELSTFSYYFLIAHMPVGQIRVQFTHKDGQNIMQRAIVAAVVELLLVALLWKRVWSSWMSIWMMAISSALETLLNSKVSAFYKNYMTDRITWMLFLIMKHLLTIFMNSKLSDKVQDRDSNLNCLCVVTVLRQCL